MNDLNDDKLRDLFNTFQPELSDDANFMARLEQSLETVEIIRRHNKMVKTYNCRALTWSALTGVAVGVVLSLVVPYLKTLIDDIGTAKLSPAIIRFVSEYYTTISWSIIGGVTLFVTLFIYTHVSGALRAKSFRGMPSTRNVSL